jgi:carboxymethylenebutenolidase
MDTVQAFQARHPEVTVHTYAAHHGFNCNHRGAWDAAAAQLARERSLAFLARHVG